MMEDLLKSIAGVDDEDDLCLKVTEAVCSESSLRLRVELSTNDTPETVIWDLHCQRALRWMLNNQSVSALDLLDDHPLLWEFKYPSASAFFSGTPLDADACLGALYKAHSSVVEDWISFGSMVNPNLEISNLLRTGNGLLARGPVPLLGLYKEALLPHGVEFGVVNEHKPRVWNGTVWSYLEGEEVRAVLLGSSYVVGIGWTCECIPR